MAYVIGALLRKSFPVPMSSSLFPTFYSIRFRVSVERIPCVCMDVAPVKKNLMAYGLGRTSESQKGFWDSARHGRFAWENVTRQIHGTGKQPCSRMYIRINGLMAKAFCKYILNLSLASGSMGLGGRIRYNFYRYLFC